MPTLQRLVAENNKQRYALREEADPEKPEETVLWIRANQGHTLEVQDLELTKIEKAEDCPVVVHGSFTKHWESIRECTALCDRPVPWSDLFRQAKRASKSWEDITFTVLLACLAKKA